MTLPFNHQSSSTPSTRIVILSDWNGTLVDKTGAPHPVICKTLKQAAENGIEVYVISDANLEDSHINLLAPLYVDPRISVCSKYKTPKDSSEKSIHDVLQNLPKDTVIIAFDDFDLSIYDPFGSVQEGVEIIHVQVLEDKTLQSHNATRVKDLIGLNVQPNEVLLSKVPSLQPNGR